jgi:hypothetical protein
MSRHSAHVDVSVLAELSAGIIGGRRAARLHAHLAGCPRCARVSAGLSEVGVLLASVPSAAMPAAVTRRLSAAIAEEAAARSATAGSPVRLAGQKPFRRAERAGGGRPRNRLTGPVAVRGFAAAAAVCLVAAGGYMVVQLTSPGRSGPTLPPGASGGIHYGIQTGPGPYHVAPSPGHAIPGSAQPAFQVITSGTDYHPAALSAQVETELGKVGKIGADTRSGVPVGHQPTAQQDGCALLITSGVKPALVDSARYQGRPATVIALASGGGQPGQAWVVGPTCSANKGDILTHVRLASSAGG